MMQRQYNVLLIAYACEPFKGSEPEVGWRWATHLSNYCNITVLTRKNNQAAIEKTDIQNIKFIYFDIPILSFLKKMIPFGTQIYSGLWEFFSYWKIRKLEFDLYHRLTFVTTVIFSRMWKLNKPYILGFLSGGEVSPESIEARYEFKYRIRERFRKVYCRLFSIIPAIKKNYLNASLIIAVTQETKELVINRLNVSQILLEPSIGIVPKKSQSMRQIDKTFKICFIGRFIGYKNIDLIIETIKRIRHTHSNIELHLFGDGPLIDNLKNMLTSDDYAYIYFRGWVSHEKLENELEKMNLLMFPSSHDSGGFAVLEAINIMIPVLCLNTGGPGEIFNGTDYKYTVDASADIKEIKDKLDEKLIDAIENYDQLMNSLLKTRKDILERYDWEKKAKKMYQLYSNVINEHTTNS